MKNKLYISAIIIAAIAVRLYFHIGHVFSDDAYYTFLSYTFYNGNFPGHYIGYPVFLLRTGQTGLTALAFGIFGISEFASIIFPFVFSLFGILLAYYFTRTITENDSAALFASLLFAFFPTDIIFSTICFPDLINAFFINLGLLFLWKAWETRKYYLTFFSGLSLLISFKFKEDLYFVLILLSVLWLYLIIKKKPEQKYILAVLAVAVLGILGESIWYLAVKGEFLYRLNVINANYKYSFYDFYPSTVYKAVGHKTGTLFALFYQIFVINLKSVFLRRFYLFIPFIALAAAVFNFKNKKHLLLSYWFIGLAVLLIGFTTSINMYKPLDLHRSWYIYPLVLPAIILTVVLLNKLKPIYKYAFIVLYVIFSMVMSGAYESYFSASNLNNFKKYIRAHQNKTIYTDFFTKYSIDLLLNYREESSRKIIGGRGFNFADLKKGTWIIYDKKHVDELKLQKHIFPKFAVLNSGSYKLLHTFGEFKVYEKIL